MSTGYVLYLMDSATDEILNSTSIPNNLKGLRLKAVSQIDYPYIIRNIFEEEIQESDKVFVLEGRLAKFI